MPETASQSPTSRLKLNIATTPEATVVRCRGMLCAQISRQFKDELKALIPQARLIVLDLSDVTFMDSSGLGAVVAVYVAAKKAPCELRLINFSKQVRELLGMTKLLSVFADCGQFNIRMP